MWLRADDSRVDFAIRVVGGMGPNGRVTVQLTCIYTGRSISIYIYVIQCISPSTILKAPTFGRPLCFARRVLPRSYRFQRVGTVVLEYWSLTNRTGFLRVCEIYIYIVTRSPIETSGLDIGFCGSG